MAHNIDSLPWSKLADYFIYEDCREQKERPDLATKDLPGQHAMIDYFARTFQKIIMKNIASQQVKLEAGFQESSQNSQFVNSVARRQMKRSKKYIESLPCYYWKPGFIPPPNEHGVFFDEYDTEAWSDPSGCCSNEPSCGYGRIAMVIEMFLIHNHLEPLFRLANLPLAVTLDAHYDGKGEDHRLHGWHEVVQSALWSYVVLNILYVKPDTWPSRPSTKDSTIQDYRMTTAYQKMLLKCAGSKNYDVFALPHRRFFGFPDSCLSQTTYDLKLLESHSTIMDLFRNVSKHIHIMTEKDLCEIALALQTKGLPMELIVQVMDLAGFDAPMSQLNVPEDPLHPDNDPKLKEYLAYCWQVMCNCSLLARWCGKEINWDFEVKMCIKALFDKDMGSNREIVFETKIPLNDWINFSHTRASKIWVILG